MINKGLKNTWLKHLFGNVHLMYACAQPCKKPNLILIDRQAFNCIGIFVANSCELSVISSQLWVLGVRYYVLGFSVIAIWYEETISLGSCALSVISCQHFQLSEGFKHNITKG